MNARSTSTIITLACLLTATPGCLHRSKVKSRKVFITHDQIETLKSPELIETVNQRTITVWIHGTKLLPSKVFNNFVYCAAGLHLANELPESYFLRQLSDAIIKADPQRFNHDDFYLFGWTGKLSAQVREQAAKDLLKDLAKLIAMYHEKHQHRPNIRLITHSHGGNIALNLARFKELNPDLTIDELILLACPVQEHTKIYLKDPIFKQIYALYSSIDLAQVLAPQFYRHTHDENGNTTRSFKFPPFSSRLFSNQENLIQVKVKFNGHAIFHTEFSTDHFTQYLPLLLNELHCWQQHEPQIGDDRHTKRLLKVYT